MRVSLFLFIALVISPWTLISYSAALETEIRVGDARFQVELARSLKERQRGLMFRSHLPKGHGMLFIQPEATPAAFWMKNTYLNLDILYFDSAGRLREIFANVPPCVTPRCPLYASKGPIKYILEINGGSAARLGISPGDRLRFSE
jgi:uncharacterized membrane protein (UPF0127 family)